MEGKSGSHRHIDDNIQITRERKNRQRRMEDLEKDLRQTNSNWAKEEEPPIQSKRFLSEADVR